MQKRQLLLAAIILVTSTAAVQSQSSTQYDKGTPPQHAVGVSSFGSYVSADLGTINLTNGALNFKIPLGSIGGRGRIALPISLNYSSKLWSASMDTDIERESGTEQSVAYADFDRGLMEGGSFGGMIGAGWTISGWPSLDAKRVLIGKIPSGPNAGCYNYLLTKLTLYLPDRGEIELRDDATDGAPLSTNCAGTTASRGTRWHATDGSGIIFINDVDNGAAQWPAPNLSGVVITSDGTRIRFGPSGDMKDRNGNKITGLTDQLGRTTTWQYNVPDPGNPSVTVAVLVTIPGYQGQNRYYKIKTGIMNQNYRSDFVNTPTPVITGDWDPEGWGYNWSGSPTRLFLKSYGLYAQRIDNLEVLTELVLPDGRSLKFKYNQFGEVAEVELPTGGRIQYDYAYRASLPTGNSPLWETGTNGAGSGITTDVKFVDRAITAKRTYPDGITLEGTWTYGFTSSTSTEMVTSASGSLLSHTRHYFLASGRYTDYFNWPYGHDGTYYNLWSTGLEYRTESLDSSGVVIAATEQDWTQRAPVSWSTYPQEQPANDNRVNQSRRYLETGAIAKVESVYDLFNNPIEVREYDFDQSLKRQTVTSYSSTELVNGTNYAADSIRLPRLPLQQSTYDQAGVEVARSIYEYDVYAADGNHDTLLSYPSITGHDTANYGPSHITRGNVTRVANWIKATNSYLYTYLRYDIAGNVVSTKDARGNVTTISFADDFGDGSNPGGGLPGTFGATYALPTLVTSSPPQPAQPQHTARSQYDFWTGLLTGFKDRNGIVAQTTYNDPFNRPTLTIAALGVNGVETRAAMYYAPSLNPYGITLTNNDVLTAKDQNTAGDGVLRAWTKTDGFGRAVETWSKDPQGDVKLRTIYDALSRTKQVSNPYRPSLGETPIYTTTGYDLAGRLISVTTPDSAVVSTSYFANTVTVTDQAGKQRKSVTDALGRLKEVYEAPNDASYNHLTSYSYDALDNLTTVMQGSQVRYFMYDSLKRLTSATNPESGIITYQYDNNGNLLVKTDARGVSSHYEYDAFNRTTRRWYNGASSVTATTHNSPALPSGVGASDEVKYFYDAQSLPSGAPILDRGYSTGRLVATSYGGGSAGIYIGFDALGKPLRSVQQTGSVNYQTSAIYNRAGGITTMTYPSGRTVTHGYDTAGRLQSFTGNLGDGTTRTYATGISYSAFGGMRQEQFGTNTPLYRKMHYNVRGQLYDVRMSTLSWTSDQWNWNRGAIINYYATADLTAGNDGRANSGPDNNGNVIRQQHWVPANDQISSNNWTEDRFTYDALNRLKSIAEYRGTQSVLGAQDFAQVYDYDRWGNRTINAAGTWGVGVNNKQFTVDTSRNRLGVPSGQAGVMSYDNAGNLTFDSYTGEGTRTYDAENRMTASAGASPASYAYDADGHRVKRIVNGTETWQVYGLGGELLAEYAANASPSTPQKEYGYRNGELLITAEAGSGGSAPPPVNVSWANVVNVTATSNSLSKSAADGWFAGAASNQAIASGDGYVEFTASETNKHRIVGLSRGDTDQSYGDIDFGIYPNDSGKLHVYEGGVSRGQVGTYVGGDLLRVSVEGGVVKYRKNGTLLYTSAVAPAYPLLVDTWLYSSGSTVTNAKISGAVLVNNVTWTNGLGVSVTGNNLTKTAAQGWNAGAVSSQTIASGDGYVEFTASETNKHRMVGVSHGDADQSYQDIDFAIYPNNQGQLWVYEGGANRGQVGTYASGDLLRVSVESGVVKYKKNGATLYTSTVAPTYPLLVDTSLYSTGSTVNNVTIGTVSGSSPAQLRWLVTDQLGTPRMVFDQTGSLANVSRHDYLPFGEELFAGVGGRTTAQGYTASDNVRQKFTSKERDIETGLDYFLARYYFSSQGRFTGVDSGPFTPADPQNFNRYAYAQNNPLKFIDPSGREIELTGDGAQAFIDYLEKRSGLKLKHTTKAGITKISSGEKNKNFNGKVNEEFAKVVKQVAGSSKTAKFHVTTNPTNDQGDRVFIDDNLAAFDSQTFVGDKWTMKPGNLNLGDINSVDEQTPELGIALVGHVLVEGLNLRSVSTFNEAHALGTEAECRILSEALGSKQLKRDQYPATSIGTMTQFSFVYTTVRYDIVVKTGAGVTVNRIARPTIARPK